MTDLIAAEEFCIYHQVAQTFITDLQNAGLVHITVVNKRSFIPHRELQKLEKIIHLHQDLDINVPGIASITHLLEKVEVLQSELIAVRNRLRMYEDTAE